MADDGEDMAKRSVLFVLLFFVVLLTVVELRQIVNDGLAEYCKDQFQVFGFVNLLLVVGTTFLESKQDDFPQSYCRLLGVASVLAWFQLLYYARGIKSIAALVQMILAVWSDMSAFFMVMCVFIVGLAHSLAVYDLAQKGIVLSTGETVEHFVNAIRDVALMSVLGDFDTSDYDTAFQALIAVFIIVVMSIVMLNLLIAVISETYERVRGIQAATINKARADLVDEMERTFLMWMKNPRYAPARISNRLKNSMMPPYLIIMSPEESHKKSADSMTEVGKLRKQMAKQEQEIRALKHLMTGQHAQLMAVLSRAP